MVWVLLGVANAFGNEVIISPHVLFNLGGKEKGSCGSIVVMMLLHRRSHVEPVEEDAGSCNGELWELEFDANNGYEVACFCPALPLLDSVSIMEVKNCTLVRRRWCGRERSNRLNQVR